ADVAVERGAAMGALSGLMIWLSMDFPRKLWEKGLLAFGFYCLIHALFLKEYYAPGGFLMTMTLMGVFLALLVPMSFRYGKILPLSFIGGSLYFGSETAVATLLCEGVGYLLIRRKKLGLIACGVGLTLLAFFGWGFVERG